MTDRTVGWLFRGAAIYGVLATLPLYGRALPAQGAEFQLGFAGFALVYQGLLWLIATDPLRYRPVMLAGAAEKLAFGLPALALWARGMGSGPVAVAALIDLALAAGFVAAWRSVGADRGNGAS